jgi:amino acid transporter
MFKSNFNDKFNWFTTMAIGVLGITFTLYGVYLFGDNAMTQPLPPSIIGFLIIAGLFVLVAIYNGVRMMFAPKDNRLDILIEKVDKLIEMHSPPKQIDIGLINKQIRDELARIRERHEQR